MPKTLYDENGNAVEAYPKEEHETELAAKIEEFKKVNPENVDIIELQDKLKVAEEEKAKLVKDLEGFKETDKGKNMAALRMKAEGAEKKVDELKENIMKELGTLKTAIEGKDLTSTFLQLADGDTEIAKKIEAEYKDIVRPDDAEEVKKQKIRKAYQLAVGVKSPGILNRILGSAGAPNPNAGAGIKSWPPELVGLGKKMGLTEEDFKNKNYVPR